MVNVPVLPDEVGFLLDTVDAVTFGLAFALRGFEPGIVCLVAVVEVMFDLVFMMARMNKRHYKKGRTVVVVNSKRSVKQSKMVKKAF